MYLKNKIPGMPSMAAAILSAPLFVLAGGASSLAGEIIDYPGAPLQFGLFDNTVASLYPLNAASLSDNVLTVNQGLPLITGSVAGAVNFDAADGIVGNNQTFIESGQIGQNVIGAISNGGMAQNNGVTVSGGSILGRTGAGVVLDFNNGSTTFMATENTLRITGGSVGQEAFGGYSVGSATNNNVFISGGDIGWGASGGLAGGDSGASLRSGDSTGNILTMTGGAVGATPYAFPLLPVGGLYGGFTFKGNATGNEVNLSGGVVTGAIYGGYTNDGDATGNVVTISGNPDLTNAGLYGGHSASSGATSGNTLNVNGFQGQIRGLGNFDAYNFHLPATINGPLLSVIPTLVYSPAGVDITDSVVGLSIAGGGAALHPGQSLTLIDATAVGLTGAPSNALAQMQQGMSLLYDLGLTSDADSLVATVNAVSVNPQTKALGEGRVAGMAFVNQGADLVTGQGMSGALDAANNSGAGNMAAFGAIGGGSSQYDTGSHVDVDGFSMMAGLGWRVPLSSNALMLGAFLEAGWGNYDSSNSFSNAASVKGDGDTSYYGGGALGRFDLTEGALSGLYLDASARLGRAKADFSSNDLRNLAGQNARYDSSSMYYGAHAGLGHVWSVNEQASIDVSTKYLWTHQNSDSVGVAGDPVTFESSNSHRWRNGARFNYGVAENIVPYIGAAYEYEFDGKAKATAYGYDIDAPELKGGTGIGELGISLKPMENGTLDLDFGVQGYVGVREGVTGRLQLIYAL